MAHVLKVRAVEGAMVPDFEAMADGVLRFVGRRHEPFVAPPAAKMPRNHTLRHGDAGAFVPTDEVVTVPFKREYLEELRAGCLAPADADTARLAGVPFAAV
jgi:hypothetical protein